MMKVFITGGTGFLGRYLLEELLNSGYELFVLTRLESKYLNALKDRYQTLHIICGDISQMDNITLDERFDCCIHLAWAGVNRSGVSVADIQRKNVQWSTDVLSFSIKHGCRYFINAGSRQEYAPTDEKITEESVCKPISEYGKAKLDFYEKAMGICRAYQIKLVHLRIFSVYGFGDHPWSLINSTILKLIQGEHIELGPCEHKWSFLYIRDFVHAVMSIFQNINRLSEMEVFNVASEDVRVLKDFIGVMQSVIPSKSEVCFGTFKQNAESSFSIIPDITKLRKLAGKQNTVEFEKGIRDIVAML